MHLEQRAAGDEVADERHAGEQEDRFERRDVSAVADA